MTKNYRVYYVIQIAPRFRVCGYCFKRYQADAVAKEVKKITDKPAFVIEFTRDELKKLNYK